LALIAIFFIANLALGATTADAVSFASAIAAHAGGLVANCVLAAILGAIGSATAVLIPAEKI